MKQLLLLSLLATQIYSSEYTFKLVQGIALKSEIEYLAHQRLTFFKEYPYLYQGTLEEERAYTNWFCDLSASVLAIAYYDDEPVGLVSGTAFVDFSTHFAGSYDLFEKANLIPETFLYVAEVIISPVHRNQSIAKKLFKLIEAYALDAGYENICLVEESHDQHPLKPSNYQSLDQFFTKLGYIKTNLLISFPWRTIQANGSLQDEEHVMNYWIKNL